MADYGSIKVFGCNAGQEITNQICERLSISPGDALVSTFGDGEVRIEIKDNVRGSDVFLVNPTNPPAENFMELYLLACALRDASANRVTLVIPYLGYNRQERKDQSRVPFSAQDFIRLIKATEAARVLLVDVHAEATSAAFRPIMPDHLYAGSVLVPHLREALDGSELVVASPDVGGAKRAEKYMKMLGADDLVICHKSRPEPGKVNKQITIVGEVYERDVLIIDDMIDSGGTLVACAKALKKAGAKRIVAAAAHGLFSNGGARRLQKSDIDEVVITDTIPPSQEVLGRSKITVVSIAPLLANAIRRLNDGQSLSELFVG